MELRTERIEKHQPRCRHENKVWLLLMPVGFEVSGLTLQTPDPADETTNRTRDTDKQAPGVSGSGRRALGSQSGQCKIHHLGKPPRHIESRAQTIRLSAEFHTGDSRITNLLIMTS